MLPFGAGLQHRIGSAIVRFPILTIAPSPSCSKTGEPLSAVAMAALPWQMIRVAAPAIAQLALTHRLWKVPFVDSRQDRVYIESVFQSLIALMEEWNAPAIFL